MSCPRCGGRMFAAHGEEPVCLRCGYVAYAPEEVAAAYEDARRYPPDRRRPGRDTMTRREAHERRLANKRSYYRRKRQERVAR